MIIGLITEHYYGLLDRRLGFLVVGGLLVWVHILFSIRGDLFLGCEKWAKQVLLFSILLLYKRSCLQDAFA